MIVKSGIIAKIQILSKKYLKIIFGLAIILIGTQFLKKKICFNIIRNT